MIYLMLEYQVNLGLSSICERVIKLMLEYQVNLGLSSICERVLKLMLERNTFLAKFPEDQVLGRDSVHSEIVLIVVYVLYETKREVFTLTQRPF